MKRCRERRSGRCREGNQRVAQIAHRCASARLDRPQSRRRRPSTSNAPKARTTDQRRRTTVRIAAADEAGIGALIYTLASTGARRGEMLGVEWSAFDPAAATLRIDRSLASVGGRLIIGPAKTAGSNRLIYLDNEAVRRLQRHRVAQAKQRLRASQWRSEAIFTNAAGGLLRPP